jgi:hypothetical protein
MLANRIELTWGFRPLVEEIFAKGLRELAQLCEHAAQEQKSMGNAQHEWRASNP